MNKNTNVRIRVKDLLAHPGTLPAAWRRIKVEVHASHLSQAAREILLAVPEPDSRQRSCDYPFETGLTLAQVFHPDAGSQAVWGQGFWSQPFRWTLHWPTLLDQESGEAYYERCARLVELTRSLFLRGVPAGQIAGLVGTAERLAGDWEVRRVTAQLVERQQKRPITQRKLGTRVHQESAFPEHSPQKR